MSAAPESNPDPTPPASSSPWNSPLAPLSLAAYVTWIAIALDPFADVFSGHLSLRDPVAVVGLAALVGQLLLFVLRALDAHGSGAIRVGPLVLAQAVLSLIAVWGLPRSGSIPVLLIIVAAQLGAVFSMRRALLLMLAANLVLAVILLARWTPTAAVSALIAYAGFQAFAVLTTTYARRAEEARDALSLINAELLATRRLLLESARGEERLRLSRELHDVAGHKLTALKLQLRVIERELPDDAQRSAVGDCVRLSDELLADVRGVVDTLRTHDGIDLHAALTALVPSALPKPRVRLMLAAEARVSGVDQAQTLLRCAQEGLTNALRHGGAENIVLRLTTDTAGIELQVEDDGRARQVPAFGNGLRGMRERLTALGGRLDLEIPAAGGLRLRAWLPADAPP